MKTKAFVALVFGGLLVAAGLLYGLSGALVPSISTRTDNITRWEADVVKDKHELTTFIAKTERLGEKQNPTPDELDRYEYSMRQLEQMGEHLRLAAERIENERSRRKHMIITTAVLAILGVLSMLVGLRLRLRG